MKKEINHKWSFDQPPAEVWEYLTRPELMELWLMKNDFQPVVGHQFQFRAGAMPQHDFDGNIYCTVLEIVPLERLSYSWKSGPGNGVVTLDSVVTWTLHPKGDGTELEIVHNGFSETVNQVMYSMMNDGWFKNVQKITNLLNNKKDGTTNP